MKRGPVLILGVVLAAAGVFLFLHFRVSPAEKALTNMLKAVQSGRFAKAESYTVDGLGVDLPNRRAKKLNRAIYSTLRFAVLDTAAAGEGVEVTVSTTMVDMETLLAEVSGELLAQSLDGKRLDENKYYKLLIRRIRSGNEKTTSKTVTVSMVYDGKTWKADMEKSKLLSY